MASLIAFLSLIGSALTVMLVGTSANLNGWIKASIVVPVVLFFVYTLARIPPAVSRQGESRLARIFAKQPVSE